MIAARFVTTCPGCSDPISPGDMIGQIGLAYFCSECVGIFEDENRKAVVVISDYPLSSQYEPPC